MFTYSFCAPTTGNGYPMAAHKYARFYLLTSLLLGLGQAACTNSDMAGGSDLRPLADLRRSNGNPAIGQICDDSHQCPTGSRCVWIVDGDKEGACAPACTAAADCDTIAQGQAACTDMPNVMGAAPSECVLYCDSKKGRDKQCPTGWSCVSVQSYLLCRPPQTPLSTDGGTPADMSVPIDMTTGDH